MATSSATGGNLTNSDTPPPEDLALEDIFQVAFSAMTGLAPELVRPRYQNPVPNQPDFDTNWMSFGVTLMGADQFAHVEHDPSVNNGVSHLSRDEVYEVLTSFYGPNGTRYLTALRDGFSIDQNRWGLMEYGIKLSRINEPTNLPALLQQRWVRRIDLRLQFARRITKTYPVNTLQAARVDLHRDTSSPATTNIIVNP